MSTGFRGHDPQGLRLKAWHAANKPLGNFNRGAGKVPASTSEIAASKHRVRRATTLAAWKRARRNEQI